MSGKEKEGESNKSQENLNEEQETVQGTATDTVVEEKAEKQVEKTIEDEYADMKDKYLRLYSEFDNFRKRTMKEKADIINSASGNVIKDVLVVLDDFERAMDNNDKVDDVEQIKEGFKLIHTKLLNTLKGKGLEWMDAKGEVFDPERHEAITRIPVEDDTQKGTVVDVVERGYNLNGKPLRYAKVVVGQ